MALEIKNTHDESKSKSKKTTKKSSKKKTSKAPIDVLAPGSRRPVADARSHFAQKKMTPNHNNAAGILMTIDSLPVD